MKSFIVIIFGRLIGKKKYTTQEYVTAIVITVAILVYSYSDFKKKSSNSDDLPLTLYFMGFSFLILSLVLDGILNGFQEWIKIKYSKNLVGMDFY